MKIVTLNLRFPCEFDGINKYPNRKQIFYDFMVNENPDIICLQEVRPSVKKEICEVFEDYNFFGEFRFIDNREEDESPLVGVKKNKFSVLSHYHYWLSPTPNIPESKFEEDLHWPRVATELVIKNLVTKEDFILINTHLAVETTYSIEMGYRQLIDRVQKLKIEKGLKIFLVGDLNAEPSFIEKIDNITLFDLTKEIKYSFHDYGKEKTKIDYILCSYKPHNYVSKLIEIKKGDVYISDHFPIACEIND